MCNGIAKNGKSYPEQFVLGEHEAYRNYGNDCVFCGLPKDAVVLPSDKTRRNPLGALGLGGLAIAALGAIGYGIWSTGASSCPAGQQRVQGNCVAVSSPPSETPLSPSKPHISNIGTYSTLADVPLVPTQLVRYGGSTKLEDLEKQLINAHPSFKLTYTEPLGGDARGSGSGIRQLLTGQISFAISSRPLGPEDMAAAKAHGLIIEQIPVAIDGIALFIHPKLQIPGLSIGQIKDIFTGKVTNWQELGGPNVPITPVSRDPTDGGTQAYFGDAVLNGEPLAASMQPYEKKTSAVLAKVGNTLGGIGYASPSRVCNQKVVKPLPIAREVNSGFISPCKSGQVNQAVLSDNSYFITQRIFVILKRDGGSDEQAGIAYINLLLSQEGQQLIDDIGLVPLH